MRLNLSDTLAAGLLSRRLFLVGGFLVGGFLAGGFLATVARTPRSGHNDTVACCAASAFDPPARDPMPWPWKTMLVAPATASVSCMP